MKRLGAPASLVDYNSMKFVIIYMPDTICSKQYIKQLQQYNARKIIKTCECAYNFQMFYTFGISVDELIYPDGSFPLAEIIDQWILIIKQHFQALPKTSLAVHCRTGLGRSAVLVAIALMESGMKPQDAIDLIRVKRRGAFNSFQMEEIVKYKSKNRLVEKAKIFKRISLSRKFNNIDPDRISRRETTI
ncbi:hypothetical protein ILUMI_24981 [Ignelater luminosus]|uniref:Protein tyrosine phosphatase type IVA 3 n=1 Tax=Ignelater luminosus TaxID=2038154 RepID=A0A8K0CBF6_IGNLU|nr:hypothetical protein ILUMI_24981 [Ignelater luminosus]